MNEYYTPPTPPPAGSRARSATIEDIIDSIDAGFDNIPADLDQKITDLQDQYIEQIGLPAIEQGKFLTSNDGVTLDWELPIPDQTSNSGKILTTDGTDASWTDQYPSQTSNSGKALTTNGTTVSWAAVPYITATAYGAGTAGDLIVLNSDGTVSVADGGTASAGSPVEFESGALLGMPASCYDSANGVMVFAFSDDADSDKGKAVVGTITAGVISFGSTATFEAGITKYISCCYDSTNGKVVICYQDDDDSDYGKAIVGTVSGTNITFGTAANFSEAATTHTGCAFDEANGKVAIFYTVGGAGTCKVGTVSGTDISFGAAATLKAAAVEYPNPCYDPDYEKVVVAFEVSDVPYISIGDIDGTDISFQGETSLSAFNNFSSIAGCVYDTVNDKVVLAFNRTGTIFALPLTVVSGTGFSYDAGNGASKSGAVTNTSPGYISMCFDQDLGKVVFFYRLATSFYLAVVLADISTGAVVFGTSATIYSTAITDITCVYMGPQAVVGFEATNGKAIVYDFTTTVFDWIGLAAETFTTGNPVKVTTVGGVNTNQTGLTPGAKYYVDIDGELSTSVSTAGEIGRALSATSILITKGGFE